MALFKLMRGSASRLPESIINGYIWVAEEEDKALHMYIDYEDDNKELRRGILSAEFANKLRYTADGTIVEIKPEDLVGKVIKDNEGNKLGEIFNNYEKNQASGLHSHAEGSTTTASAPGAHAEGILTTASGERSHAEGSTTLASGAGAHAEGVNTKATGDRSHAEGSGSEASGAGAHAEGVNTRASGLRSHAEGSNSEASGAGAHAEGVDTIAEGEASHSEGKGTIAKGEAQHAGGIFNIIDDNNEYLEIVGNGTYNENRSNARTLDRIGNAWYAGEVYVGADKKRLITEDELVQSDWNQNDENAPDYVKNRTHYIGTTTALEQKTETYNVSTSYGSPGDVTSGKHGYFVDNDTLDTIVSNNRSNYTINGETATIITVPEYHNSVTGEIGASFQGLQSASYKFAWLRGCGGYCLHHGIESSTEETSFTITYDEEVEVPYYHPLDEKFIPDTIAHTSIIKDLSNALKGNKSGAEVVCDVSPIEHTLKVKARRKNLFDISKVINEADIQVGTGAKITATNNVLSDFIAIPPNTAFVGNFIRHCAFYDINKNYISDIGSKSATTKRALTTPSNAYYMRFSYQTGVTDGSNIQIELGTTETPYTPYVADITTAKVIVNGSQTYPINADGTMEGITSLYPTTTLTTDTEGIVLDVEYNRDINSAFAELTQAIISLGGNL